MILSIGIDGRTAPYENDFVIVLLVFLGTLLLGWVLIERLPLGYTEAALLYLSAVLAAGAFWTGRKK